MSDETNKPDVEETVAQPSQEDASADLTIQDLAAVKSIIDVASSRGAFKPNEMVAVGTIYSKLERFLNLATKQGQNANA